MLVFSLPVWAQNDSGMVHSWLAKTSEAMRTLNYEGTFVYSHNGKLESMRIIHKVDAYGEHERLVSLNGEAREVIRNNTRITCILPASKSVVVDKSRPKQFFPFSMAARNINRLDKYYEFRLGKQERIAGRMAQRVSIKPRDIYRYGYRLWIDTESGILLKSDMLNTRGRSVEQVMFTDIRINHDIPSEALTPQIVGKEYKWFADDEKPSTEIKPLRTPEWKVSKLPQGYMMAESNHHRLPTSKWPVEHLVYTDGLATVSVYVEKLQGKDDSLHGVSHMGAVHAYGNVVDKHQVTVVGEVPQQAVELIGNSIVHMPGK